MAAAMLTVPMRGMTPLPQDLATTCWYTCFVMMYAWKGQDPDGIKDKLIAAGVLWDDACKSGLKTHDLFKSAKALGMVPWGAGQSWSAYDFQRWLAVSPVWVAGRWMADASHNVVVIGASDTEIKYIDPWWEGTKEATITTRPADWFIHGNGRDIPGTDFYMTRIGAVQAWASA